MRSADNDHHQHDHDLDRDDDIIEERRPARAAHEQRGEQQDDHSGGDVKQPMHSAGRRPRRGRIGEKGGGQLGRHMDPEPLHHAIEVAGPSQRRPLRARGIFQNEIPADDPGENLAERHISIGVGAPRDGNERRKLRVAERDKGAGEPRQHEGDHDAGPGVIRRRRAGQHENAGADDFHRLQATSTTPSRARA